MTNLDKKQSNLVHLLKLIYLRPTIALSLGLLLVATSAQAYYSTMDTAELLEAGQYKITAESQFATSGDEGVNLVARFDSYFTEDSNLKALVGVGTTDFQIGGFFKWIPIPDYENQPAMGVIMGVNYARAEDTNDLSIRFHPLVSKKFETNFGAIVPYGAIPFGIRSRDGDNELPIQVEVGSELQLNQIQKFRFLVEVGFDVTKAFSYISFGASMNFDGETGLEF